MGPPTQVMLPAHDANLELRIHLVGHPDHVRNTLAQLLGSLSWKVEFNHDGWSGRATKGDKTLNMLLGALAQYHEIHFAFQALPDGTGELILYRLGSGCMGGLFGMYQVRKGFRETSQMVYHTLAQQRLAVNVIGRSN